MGWMSDLLHEWRRAGSKGRLSSSTCVISPTGLCESTQSFNEAESLYPKAGGASLSSGRTKTHAEIYDRGEERV